MAVLKAFGSSKSPVEDRIRVLPEVGLGEKTAGIVSLSVANGREAPDHRNEMGTQWLMGETVKVWKSKPYWLLVQGNDGYLAWIERGSLVNCTPNEAKAWENKDLGIITDYEAVIRSRPDRLADPVSDVVMGDRVRIIDRAEEWARIEFPDGRQGFLEKKSIEDWRKWKETRTASSPSIERTGRLFLGRPYLWGGCSSKGFDCSGFSKLVFSLNGLALPRNAAEQANCGKLVEMGANLENLRAGDLLFFGRKKRRGAPPEVSHVAIYLKDKLFIQSSQRVRISSLNPEDPSYDERHSRQLLAARRVLP
jgi:SH3-like domain-containing protein